MDDKLLDKSVEREISLARRVARVARASSIVAGRRKENVERWTPRWADPHASKELG